MVKLTIMSAMELVLGVPLGANSANAKDPIRQDPIRQDSIRQGSILHKLA